MVFELADAEKELFKTLIDSHIELDYHLDPDYNLWLFGYSIVGYPKRRDKRKKLLITDLDGVWNAGDQIFVGYLKQLANEKSLAYNEGIKNNFDRIIKTIYTIGPENVDYVVDCVSEIFRECDLKLHQHRYACKHSIDEISLTHHAAYCLGELERMRYDIFCFSGSPDLAVKTFAATRMGLSPRRAFGSKYRFKGQDFEKIEPLLYKYKRPAVIKILKRFVGTLSGLNMVLSDEPGDIRMVASSINPFILVEDVEEFLEEKYNVVIKIPEFKKDATVLPMLLKKIERAFYFYFRYTKDEREKILASALGLKEYCEHIESEEDEELVWQFRNKALEYFNDYKANAHDLFPTILSNIDTGDFSYKLETAESVKGIKLASSDFWNEFIQRSPDWYVAEKYFIRQKRK